MTSKIRCLSVSAALRATLAFALAVGLAGSLSAAAKSKHKNAVAAPARISVSANFDGEVEPCGCKVRKGGLARRAAFLEQTRVDSAVNLTVEAGNFSPMSKTRTDSIRVLTFTDFYRRLNYDAVGLSSREMTFGAAMWQEAARNGLPVVAANLFADQRGKKPLFRPFVIKKDRNGSWGIIGFVSESAWKAHADTTEKLRYLSPFTQKKLIRKIAKKCDHLIVLGEFTSLDADSLVRMFPEIDVVVSSGIRADQVTKVGDALVVGASSRGYYASYLDWNSASADTTSGYIFKQQVLDPTVPDDSTVVKLLGEMNDRVKAPAAQP